METNAVPETSCGVVSFEYWWWTNANKLNIIKESGFDCRQVEDSFWTGCGALSAPGQS
jgi:hypothetical protein